MLPPPTAAALILETGFELLIDIDEPFRSDAVIDRPSELPWPGVALDLAMGCSGTTAVIKNCNIGVIPCDIMKCIIWDSLVFMFT